MAWIKIEDATPRKPEIARLAAALNSSIGDAFLEFVTLYLWADANIACPGFVPNLSPDLLANLARVRSETIAALASHQIGWIKIRDDGIEFVHWERHNGKSAKQRLYERERKALYRSAGTKDGAKDGTKDGTKSAQEGEGEGEDISDIRDETIRDADFCKNGWEEAKLLAKRFNGLGLAAKPQDASLVLKTCYLRQSGQLPEDIFERAIDALRKTPRKKPAAYLTACLKAACSDRKLDFKRMLATTPEEPK